MALSETSELLIKLSAQNNTAAAFGKLSNQLDGIKSAALKVAGVLAGAFAFRDVIASTRQWNSDLDNLHDTLGVTGQAAAALNYQAQVVGITADDLATAFGQLTNKIGNSIPAIQQHTSDFDKWGISVLNASNQLRPAEEILADVRDRVQQLGPGLAARQLEMDLFSRSGGRLHDFLSLDSQALQQMSDDMKLFGIATTTEGVAAGEKMNQSMNRLNAIFDMFKVQVGQALIPVLLRLAQTILPPLSGALKKLGEAFRPLLGFVKEAIDRLGGFFSEIEAKGLARALEDLVRDVIRKIADILPKIGEELDKLGPLGWVIKLALIGFALEKVVGIAEMLFGPLIGIFRGVAGLGVVAGTGAFPILLSVGAGIAIGLFVNSLIDNSSAEGMRKKWSTFQFWADLIGLAALGAGATLVVGGSPLLALAIAGALAVTWLVTQDYGGTSGAPKEGDTQMIAGEQWIFRNGEWHKAFTIGYPPAPPGPPAGGTVGGTGGGHPEAPDCPAGYVAIADGIGGWACVPISQSGGGGGGENLAMAAGGIVTRPTRAIVGEAGPEAVIPLDQVGSMGTTVIVNVSGSVISEGDLARTVGDYLLKMARGQKNFAIG